MFSRTTLTTVGTSINNPLVISISLNITITAYYLDNALARWLTVPAYDADNNPLSANVYIDGLHYGTTGSSFCVSVGSHTLQVDNPNPSVYAFESYTYDGGPSSNNPLPLLVSSSMAVTAHYSFVYHYLTVDASDQYGYVPAGVSIDGGQWTGTAGDSFYVPAGYHYVTVDSEFNYQGGIDVLYATSWQDPVWVDSATQVEAYYCRY